MADNYEKVELMMKELGCTGAHITSSGIKERIVDIDFETIELAGTRMMFCGIALKTNNPDRPFTVVGEPSMCIDPENWRDEIGREVSFNNAFRKIWQLEAYREMTSEAGE